MRDRNWDLHFDLARTVRLFAFERAQTDELVRCPDDWGVFTQGPDCLSNQVEEQDLITRNDRTPDSKQHQREEQFYVPQDENCIRNSHLVGYKNNRCDDCKVPPLFHEGLHKLRPPAASALICKIEFQARKYYG